MLMFGSNNKDLSNVDSLITTLNRDISKLGNTNTDIEDKQDYQYLKALITKLKRIHAKFHDDWLKYTYISKTSYESRNLITKARIQRNKYHYKEGVKVLYYVGDQYDTLKKWRQRWTGPWLITMVLNDSTVIITDIQTGNQKRVSIDRIKIVPKQLDAHYDKLLDDPAYNEYHNRIKHILSKPDVESEQPGTNLQLN